MPDAALDLAPERCEVPELRGVTVHDEAADALIHRASYPLADGRTLRLRIGRGRIVGEARCPECHGVGGCHETCVLRGCRGDHRRRGGTDG